MMELNLIHTVAFAGIVLFFGHGMRRVITPLARYNIPAPVIGGLLVAVLITWTRRSGLSSLSLIPRCKAPS